MKKNMKKKYRISKDYWKNRLNIILKTLIINHFILNSINMKIISNLLKKDIDKAQRKNLILIEIIQMKKQKRNSIKDLKKITVKKSKIKISNKKAVFIKNIITIEL